MSFARSLLTVGSGTALSRLLGFVRDILLANFLGAGAVADAFVVAFRLPNLFRRLLSEGAFNAGFVPLFAQIRRENGESAAQGFAGQVLLGLTGFAVVATILAEIFMPGLVFALAPGFFKTADEAALTIFLSRLTFPFLGFCLISSVFSALLNAREDFGIVAFAPVVLNLVLIAALVAAGRLLQDAVVMAALVAAGVSLAGLAQVLWCLFGQGARAFIWQRLVWSAQMKALILLALPGIVAGGVTQINSFIGALVGSGQQGAVSQLYYADRVYQLPLGLVSTALGLVLLPKLARAFGESRMQDAQRLQNAAIESALFLTLPAAMALGVAAFPITTLLFQHGAFSAESARGTALALQAFALGLPAFALAKALQPSFFARGKMRAPLIIALVGGVLDLALSLALFPSLHAQGIALAAAAAGWFNALALIVLLLRGGIWTLTAPVVARLLRMALAAAMMGGVVWFLEESLAAQFSQAGLVPYFALGGLCLGGLLAYLLACLLLRCVNWRDWREIP